MGKKESKKRYFHSSPKRFQVGKIIGGNRDAVFITSKEKPHFTIAERAVEEGWHIYEVQPIGSIIMGRCWQEGLVGRAEIIKYIGNARGIGKDGKASKYEFSISKDIMVGDNHVDYWK